MSAPFVVLAQERMDNVQKCVGEAMSRLDKWKMLSGSTLVTLDEVAWLAAVFCKAGLMNVETEVSQSKEGNVISVVAGDGLKPRD